jgi:hypothetical protein
MTDHGHHSHHILSHAAGSIELVLDEDTGEYQVRFLTPLNRHPDLLRDLRRWIRLIGRGWAKRHGTRIAGINFTDDNKTGSIQIERTQSNGH